MLIVEGILVRGEPRARPALDKKSVRAKLSESVFGHSNGMQSRQN